MEVYGGQRVMGLSWNILWGIKLFGFLNLLVLGDLISVSCFFSWLKLELTNVCM